MRRRLRFVPALGVLALSLGLSDGLRAGGTDAGAVRFNRDVRPILSQRCFSCHGPDQKKAGLDLQSRASALKPLRSGAAAVVPGRSAASRLIQRVSAPEEGERMPPRGRGDRLSPAEVATLRAWIDQGAPWEEHWAYLRPERPQPPPVRDPGWVRNGIDPFILARLEREGLAPAPEADRATLLRRVSLDLTGLPPTVPEVDAFLADRGPDAYERVVERLLASPHYGERRAAFWLDQARYADSTGYAAEHRRSIWPYRDWVIGAFNHNLPFDRFTVEQIAGDLLPGATLEQRVATGFHRNTMVNTEGGIDDEEFRVAAVVDRVNTTMAVWMGTTMACAQCHNHKYDPFSQAEYYRLFAFFNNTEDRGSTDEPSLPLPAAEPAAGRGKALAVNASVHSLLVMPQPLLAAVLAAAIRKGGAALPKGFAPVKPATTLVLKELPRPRPTHVLIRGSHNRKGDPVHPGVPAKWHPLPEGQPANRLALARWLVDPQNPLVGRVTVNRVWAQYFGRGLVETGEDFGARGEPPTHPELLDWLATELVRRSWDLKALQRLIVTSATYRQSSRVTRPLYERDPYNRLYARGPSLRLEAEVVRDQALAVSGLLSRKVGGPSVFPYQPEGVWLTHPSTGEKWVMSSGGDRHRRGLYTFWRRTTLYPAFAAFDAPSRDVACERRPRTNTPLQALVTLNDPTFVEAAAALARRMMTEAPGGDRERAVHGFRLCVGRAPTAAELGHLLDLYRENLERYRKDPEAAGRMAAGALAGVPSGIDRAELASWTVVANLLLNLDETITKG